MSENNGSSVFVEMLRGRDGLPGRDGPQGPAGPPGPVGPPGPRSGGAIYTRWGKSSCPQIAGTELVYSGLTGGSNYNQQGGGANYLCMPTDPEYSPALRYRPGHTNVDTNGHATHVYGAEYQFPLQGTHNYNVPCAVCYVSTRPTMMMIPAKYRCPSTWTTEYNGYLMTQYRGYHRSTFECVDDDQEALHYSVGNTDGALFYHTEAECSHGHLPCSDREDSYRQGKELNCVVCTK